MSGIGTLTWILKLSSISSLLFELVRLPPPSEGSSGEGMDWLCGSNMISKMFFYKGNMAWPKAASPRVQIMGEGRSHRKRGITNLGNAAFNSIFGASDPLPSDAEGVDLADT